MAKAYLIFQSKKKTPFSPTFSYLVALKAEYCYSFSR